PTPLLLSSWEGALVLPGAGSSEVRYVGRERPMALTADAGRPRERFKIDLSCRHPSGLVAVLRCTDLPFRRVEGCVCKLWQHKGPGGVSHGVRQLYPRCRGQQRVCAGFAGSTTAGRSACNFSSG